MSWKQEPIHWAPEKKLGGGWKCFKDSPSPPPAPDYTGAANATAAGNLEAAQFASNANRVDQYTPFGASTWTNNNPTDPNNPQWAQTTTLDPQLQDALSAQIDTQDQRSQFANNLLGQVQTAYATPFNAPNFSSYTAGVNPTNQTAVNVNDYTGGLPALQQTAQGGSSYLSNVPGVNYNAPTYDPSQAQQFGQASFNAANAYLQPQNQLAQTNLNNSLQLQGLSPGSQAYQASTGALLATQAQAQNQLANQSLLTGNQIAQSSYQQQLAGYNAGNTAQNQGVTQGLNTQQADLAALGVNNAAAQGNYSNALGTDNQQNLNQQANNNAINQAYQQALSQYQTQYGANYAQQNMPLNELNALLNGQQVSNPTFPSYPLQQTTAGPDLLGAATQQANYNQGVYNTQAASTNASNASTTAAVGTVAAAALAFF